MNGIIWAIVYFFAFLGSGLTLLAAVGVLRMPDVYCRMHPASKAGSLGVACIMVSVALQLNDTYATVQAALVAIFLFAAAPIAAHMIGRATYVSGPNLAEETAIDDLKGKYEAETFRLAGWHETPDAAVPSDQSSPGSQPENTPPFKSAH